MDKVERTRWLLAVLATARWRPESRQLAAQLGRQMPQDAAPWILAAAIFNAALALFHVLFWRVFGWPETLARSGSVNSAIAQVMNLALIFLFTLSGLICFFFPADLASTAMGRFWLFAMAGFWLARALLQPIFFSFDHWLSSTLLAVFVLGAAIHAGAWYGSSGI